MSARLALTAITAAAALAVAGCGAGTPVAEHRALGSLRSLEVSGGVSVRAVRAAAPSVTA